MKLARRLDHIEPFYVMECAKAAAELARSPECADSPMIFLNIGEPDFTAPPLVRAASERAVSQGRTQYTDATGLLALRERISGWYATRFGLSIDPRRIVVTAGASAALQGVSVAVAMAVSAPLASSGGGATAVPMIAVMAVGATLAIGSLSFARRAERRPA